MARQGYGKRFSVDASVRIEGQDRPGLERLLRYCARPPFALERLEQLGDDQLVYRFAKPQPDGRTALSLTPLELIEGLAAAQPAAAPAHPPSSRGAGTPPRLQRQLSGKQVGLVNDR